MLHHEVGDARKYRGPVDQKLSDEATPFLTFLNNFLLLGTVIGGRFAFHVDLRGVRNDPASLPGFTNW